MPVKVVCFIECYARKEIQELNGDHRRENSVT